MWLYLGWSTSNSSDSLANHPSHLGRHRSSLTFNITQLTLVITSPAVDLTIIRHAHAVYSTNWYINNSFTIECFYDLRMTDVFLWTMTQSKTFPFAPKMVDKNNLISNCTCIIYKTHSISWNRFNSFVYLRSSSWGTPNLSSTCTCIYNVMPKRMTTFNVCTYMYCIFGTRLRLPNIHIPYTMKCVRLTAKFTC
jgi:hypothetical protein